MFVGGTFAVIVPTPNGAGPWHFAVITMMMLYGVNATDAGIFALIVHGIQTLLVIVLGKVPGSCPVGRGNKDCKRSADKHHQPGKETKVLRKLEAIESYIEMIEIA